MTGLNPFDWYGAEFLALYAFLFVGAWIASYAIASWLRPEGTPIPVRDDDELAVLGGKGERLAEVAIARMLAKDALELDASRKIRHGRAATAQSELERDILALDTPLRWSKVRRAANAAADRIEEGLVRRGLLMERGEARMLGLFSAMPLLLLIGFGFIKVEIGMARGRPVEFLVVFMCITAVVALYRYARPDPRTKGGIRAWTEARSEASRLRIAPTGQEVGRAVALFGTGVLATGALGEFHRLRAHSGSGGDGGGGGSDGDGGCGGGGCGGCGG